MHLSLANQLKTLVHLRESLKQQYLTSDQDRNEYRNILLKTCITLSYCSFMCQNTHVKSVLKKEISSIFRIYQHTSTEDDSFLLKQKGYILGSINASVTIVKTFEEAVPA
ncbi:hypothetical protein [Chitinophaga rhizophila]|uniref:Uncharacterized protein n=1 Tax=Chitinophaga rhizophila TaxID=2866212 RepID=A0ABS7G7Z0_9BACT|nr:hypothetical protein [Chitinophaga rhizophila]MBW8683782.1 hypothetical protein [Chitinophaga rhizophila]